MTTLLHRVRCDNKARPWWEAVAEEERDAIVALIPDDHYLTILHSNASPPFSVRLLRATPDPNVNVLIDTRRAYSIEVAAAAVLGAV